MPQGRARTTLLLGALGLVGVSVFLLLRDLAFPVAVVEPVLPRDEVIARSADLLFERLDEDVSGFQASAGFGFDPPFEYLDRTLGTPEVNRLLREGHYPLAVWYVRFFLPGEVDEYELWWTAAGRLACLSRTLPEARHTGAFPDRDHARAFVEAFLTDAMGIDVAALDSTEASVTVDPTWTNHTFTWNERDPPADLRVKVYGSVQGQDLIYACQTLLEPAAYTQARARVGEWRELVQDLASAIDSLLTVALMVAAVLAWRARRFPWRFALALAGAVTAVGVVAWTNALPLAWSRFPSEAEPLAWWGARLLRAAGQVLTWFAWALVVVGASEAVARWGPRRFHALSDLVREPFHASRTARSATVAGYGLAGLMLGWVVLFYLAGRFFDVAYVPVEAPVSNVLSTRTPWLEAFRVGARAAFSEESVYRLFAVAGLLVLTRRRWVAVLLPAVLWGFLHTSYDVDPIFARGLELTGVGVVLGFALLRYGLWATLVAHYLYNVAVSAQHLLGSRDPWVVAPTVGLFLLPALPTALAWWSRRSQGPSGEYVFPDEPRTADAERTAAADLSIAPDEPPPASVDGAASPPASAEDGARTPEPPARALPGWRPAVLLGLLSVLAVLLLPPRPTALVAQTSRGHAIARAQRLVRDLGYEPGEAEAFASLELGAPSDDLLRFLDQNTTSAERRAQLERWEPVEPRWTVRLADLRGHQSWFVTLSRSRDVWSFRFDANGHVPTESVGQEAARALALDFLRSQRWRVDDLERMTHSRHDDENGTRHDFTWVLRKGGVKGAERRVRVWTYGERVAGYGTWLDLPEDWEREATRSSGWRGPVEEVAFVVIALGLLLAVGIPLARRRVPGLRWSRGALVVAGATALAAFAAAILQLRSVGVQALDHDAPLGVFVGKGVLNALPMALVPGVLAGLGWLLLVGLSPRLRGGIWGGELLPETWSMPPWRWRGAREAIAWALASVALSIAASSLAAWLRGAKAFEVVAFDPLLSSASSPLLFFLAGLTLWAFVWVGLAGLLVLLRSAWGARGMRGWLVLLGTAVAVGAWASGDEDAVGLVGLVVWIGVIGLWPAFAFWGVLLIAAGSLLPCLLYGTADVRPAAVAVWVLLLGALALAYRARPRPDRDATAGGP